MSAETPVERRIAGVAALYRSIPGMSPTRAEQDLTADALDAGREAIALLRVLEPACYNAPSWTAWKTRVSALLARLAQEGT